MDINAVIAEATTVAEPVEASTEATQAVETPQEQPEPAQEDIGSKPDSELTPEQLAKREANRRSHENSRAARLKREVRELREENARIKALAQQPAANSNDGPPKPPNEADFSNWDDLRAAERKYYEDLADWKVEQKLRERDTKQNESAQAQAVNASKSIRVQEISRQTQEFAKSTPEYLSLVNEYSDFFESIPDHIEAALLEADNTPLAVFALMKEGRLRDLEDMSPYRLSMEIGKAELRGESYLNRNKATNAPAPVRAAKGTGDSSKSLHSMSVDDLMKRYNTR